MYATVAMPQTFFKKALTAPGERKARLPRIKIPRIKLPKIKPPKLGLPRVVGKTLRTFGKVAVTLTWPVSGLFAVNSKKSRIRRLDYPYAMSAPGAYFAGMLCWGVAFGMMAGADDIMAWNRVAANEQAIIVRSLNGDTSIPLNKPIPVGAHSPILRMYNEEFLVIDAATHQAGIGVDQTGAYKVEICRNGSIFDEQVDQNGLRYTGDPAAGTPPVGCVFRPAPPNANLMTPQQSPS